MVIAISVTAFLLRAVDQLQSWLGIAAILFLLHAGFLIWSAGDNPTQRARGWRQLVTVVAGLLVIIFAKDLIRTVYSWAGVTAPF